MFKNNNCFKYVMQIRFLDVSSNRYSGTSNCAAIGSIVRKCEVAKLKIRNCEHSIDELKALQEGLNYVKVKSNHFRGTILNTLYISLMDPAEILDGCSQTYL